MLWMNLGLKTTPIHSFAWATANFGVDPDPELEYMQVLPLCLTSCVTPAYYLLVTSLSLNIFPYKISITPTLCISEVTHLYAC